MTHRVVFAPEANTQLVALFHYIAKEASPDIAKNFADAIVTHCEGLDKFPRRGTKRDDIRSGLRTIGFRRRVTIAFTVDASTVVILGVFYGGQDYETILQDDEES